MDTYQNKINKACTDIFKEAPLTRRQNRKVNIAILGGAFNPITMGHIQIALFVLKAGKIFDEVWIMPCYKHIYSKKMAETHHRLAMCTIAASKDERVKVCDYEIKKKFERGTYYLIKQLLEENFVQHRYNFSLIIGQDNANIFDKWVKHEALQKMIRFVIVPRQGVNTDTSVNWYLKSPHMYLAADKPVIKVSSTQVRELLKKKQYSEVHGLLDIDVLAYIRKNNLYCK